MTRYFVILSLVAALLAGCGSRKVQETFDGQSFRTKAGRVEDDRQQFVIAVSPASVSLQGAAEAGRYESTRYCIENYGNSEVDWVVGPDQDPGTYRIENDTLVLRGKCAG